MIFIRPKHWLDVCFLAWDWRGGFGLGNHPAQCSRIGWYLSCWVRLISTKKCQLLAGRQQRPFKYLQCDLPWNWSAEDWKNNDMTNSMGRLAFHVWSMPTCPNRVASPSISHIQGKIGGCNSINRQFLGNSHTAWGVRIQSWSDFSRCRSRWFELHLELVNHPDLKDLKLITWQVRHGEQPWYPHGGRCVGPSPTVDGPPACCFKDGSTVWAACD